MIYFLAEPIYKEDPMENVPAELKKKKKQEQAPRVPSGYNYKFVVAPSINSDTIDASKFKVFTPKYEIRAQTHLSPNMQPFQIKWCGNKAIVVQYYNQEMFMHSI